MGCGRVDPSKWWHLIFLSFDPQIFIEIIITWLLPLQSTVPTKNRHVILHVMYILYKSIFFQQFGFHFSDLNVWLFNNPAAEKQVSPTHPLLIRFRERSSSLKVSSLERSLLRSQTWFQTFSWSPEYKCAWKWNNWEDRTNLLQTENLRHQTSWCLTEPQCM